MVVEGTPKLFVDAAELKFNGSDKSTQLSTDVDKSLCNGALVVTMTNNWVLNIQDSLSRRSFVNKRSSPRLINIEESRKPNEINNKVILNTPTKSLVLEVGGEKYGESPLKRRASPRLRAIPESKRPYYGPSRKESHHHHIDEISEELNVHASKINLEPKVGEEKTKESSENRRFSPRLRSIPEIERPYYGPNRKESHHLFPKMSKHNPDSAKQNLVLEVGGDNNGDKPFESDAEHCKENGLPNGSGKPNSIIGLSNCFVSVNAIPSLSASEGVNSINTWEQWADEINSSCANARVKETLSVYNKYYLHFLQEEDTVKKGKPDVQKVVKSSERKVQFTERASRVSREPNLVCNDISESQEDIRIPVSNSVDDAPIAPKGFVYTKSNQVANNVILPPNAVGCKCKGDCTNPKTCACAKLNGSDFPYVRKDGGRLIEAKDVVVECGPNCGCGPSCINRISQRGIKYHLEVFRTENKGWAVKTKDFIPSGAPVCEYFGVLRKTNELDNVAENDYIFEMDCLQTMKEIEGRERRLGDVSASVSKLLEKMDERTLESNAPEFCIDAGSVGNVARFINHSCEPNLFVQCVLSTHHDLRLARVVLFAADDIAPLEELTYDYGYALDSVIDSNGNIREQSCHCGTAECRKRLY